MKINWDKAPPSVCDMYADALHAPVQQRWIYGAICSALGRRVRRVSMRDQDGFDTVHQFVSRRLLSFEVMLGLRVGMSAETAQAVRGSIPTGTFLALSPETAHPGAGFHPVVSAQTLARLAINKPDDILRATMHQKWRNRLNFSTSEGLDLRHVTCDRNTLSKGLHLEIKQQKDRRYRALPPAFTQAWHEISPETMRHFSARKNGQIVATMLFLRHGNTATYHMGWTNHIGRKCCAHHALMWRAMQDLRDDNVDVIDLGSLNTHDSAGLARFKLGTGAPAIETGQTYVAFPRRSDRTWSGITAGWRGFRTGQNRN